MDMNFFAAMAWKSALIAGAALALAYALRSRAAADRALVLRIGVAMLLALPLIALFLPALRVVAFSAPTTAPLPHLTDAQIAALLAMAPASPAPAPTIWDDPTPLVILAYLGGLAMAGARLLGGLFTLSRWTRAARPVTDAVWVAALERVRWAAPNPESIRLLVADGIKSPLSWGWRRPAILVDADTLVDVDDAEAILAHEVAHIARRDWPALMLSRIAAALFWFNPLVWMLEREVVQQAEEAADREAAEQVEPARYAETLLGLAQVNALVPANNIAPSARALARRIRAILDRSDRPQGSAWTAFAMLACIGVAAPVAAMQLVAAAPPSAPRPPAAPDAPSLPDAPMAPDAPAAPAAPDAPIAPRAPHVPHASRVADLGDIDMPDVGAIVAEAMAAVDPDEIARVVRDAHVNARLSAADRARVRVAVDHARHVQIPHARIEAAMRQASVAQAQAEQIAARAEVQARQAVRIALASSGTGMMRGADSMEAGARRMEQQAAQMRDPTWRARAIERARQRGETVTDGDLIETAGGLEEGARGMRDGAREMRDSARRMQRGDIDDSDD